MPLGESLLLSVHDLRADAGDYLGYGRGDKFSETAWTTRQAKDIDVCLKSGLAQVYWPPLVNDRPQHRWSFLQPFMEVRIPQGETEVNLPETFGGFTTPLFVQNPQNSVANRLQLRLRNEVFVRQLLAASPDRTGYPLEAAEVATVATTRNASNRPRLIVWPTPDAAYTLTAGYKHIPGALTGDYPYPPGGAEHSELFKASVIAAAELQKDDAPGPRRAFFMERLAAAIASDSRRKGQLIGYNGDYSANRRRLVFGSRYWDRNVFPAITYNGQSFD